MKNFVCRTALVLISSMIFGVMVVAQKDTSEVKGLLWNAACKNGVPDAQIVLSDGRKKYKTKSDRSGKYLFRNVRSGNFQIEIKRYGFRNIIQGEIRIVEAESRTLNFEMQPGFATDDPNPANFNPCDYSVRK